MLAVYGICFILENDMVTLFVLGCLIVFGFAVYADIYINGPLS